MIKIFAQTKKWVIKKKKTQKAKLASVGYELVTTLPDSLYCNCVLVISILLTGRAQP